MASLMNDPLEECLDLDTDLKSVKMSLAENDPAENVYSHIALENANKPRRSYTRRPHFQEVSYSDFCREIRSRDTFPMNDTELTVVNLNTEEDGFLSKENIISPEHPSETLPTSTSKTVKNVFDILKWSIANSKKPDARSDPSKASSNKKLSPSLKEKALNPTNSANVVHKGSFLSPSNKRSKVSSVTPLSTLSNKIEKVASVAVKTPTPSLAIPSSFSDISILAKKDHRRIKKNDPSKLSSFLPFSTLPHHNCLTNDEMQFLETENSIAIRDEEMMSSATAKDVHNANCNFSYLHFSAGMSSSKGVSLSVQNLHHCQNVEIIQQKALSQWKSGFPNFPVLRIWQALQKKAQHSSEVLNENGSSNGNLWSDKYRPLSRDLFLGHASKVDELQDWLTKWRRRTDREAKRAARAAKLERQAKSKKAFRARTELQSGSSEDEFHLSDCSTGSTGAGDEDGLENDLPSAILLVGPNGAGKTCLAHTMVLETGYKIFEINSSSSRNRNDIVEALQEIMESHHVTQNQSLFTMWNIPSSKEEQSSSKEDSSNRKSVTTKKSMRKKRLTLPSSDEDSQSSATIKRRRTILETGVTKTDVSCDSSLHTVKECDDPTEIEDKAVSNIQKASSKVKVNPCSLLLFDEVDVTETSSSVEVDDDSKEGTKQMWNAIKYFVRLGKRPILLTTNRITATLCSELSLSPASVTCPEPNCRDASLRLKVMSLPTCSVQSVSLFLALICLHEKYFIDSLSELEQLVSYHHADIRACLLNLQYSLCGSALSSQLDESNYVYTTVPSNVSMERSLDSIFNGLDQCDSIQDVQQTYRYLCTLDELYSWSSKRTSDHQQFELWSDEMVNMASRLIKNASPKSSTFQRFTDCQILFSGLGESLPLRQSVYGCGNNLTNHCARDELSLDYAPCIRTLCSSEDIRQKEKDSDSSFFSTPRRRRFLHYCDQICLDLPKSAMDAAARSHRILSTSVEQNV